MPSPGTRFFIGPLTEAQQRRRERSRETFRVADEIAYARNITMREAFSVARDRPYELATYRGYATGEYP